MLFKFQWVVGITLRLGTEVEIEHPGEFIESSVPLALHLPHLFAGALLGLISIHSDTCFDNKANVLAKPVTGMTVGDT